MHQILFNLFGYVVRSYPVVIVCTIFLGYGLTLAITRNTIYYKHFKDFIVYGIIGAIIGARIWHVFVFQWPTYSHHPLQILKIWDGGISIEGAIAGGVVALIIYCRKYKLNILEFADYIASPMILSQGIGRIACLLNGDAFGKPTGEGFGLVYPKGTIAYSYYGSQPLWPAEVWKSQGDMVIFVIVFMIFSFYRERLGKGWIVSSYVVLYSLERFLLEFLRGDSPRYDNLTGGQWSSLVMIVIVLAFMVYLSIRDRKGKVSETHIKSI
jgi:phosphatidylglycerol:prolipoprotein diacylglycerol transferase